MTTTTATLSLIVEAQDRASRVLSRISDSVSRLGGIAGGIAGTLAQFGGQVLDRLLGAVLALGEGILKLGVSVIRAGSDAEEMQSKFNAVFKDLAGPVTDNLTAFAKQVGRNKFELMGFAAILQDTFVPLGFARDEAADMSTQLVKLAIDLASFNNVAEGDVIRDLQSALVGNTETLRKYGVVATISAIKQFALNNAIWDGEGAISAQEKAAAILGITLAATTDAQGDAIKTAGGFANQMRALMSTIAETKTEIGQKLLPVVTPLISKFLELALDAGPKLVSLFDAKIIPVLIRVRDAIINVIDNGFDPWLFFIQRVSAQIVEFTQRMRGFFNAGWARPELIEQAIGVIKNAFESNFGSIDEIIANAREAFSRLTNTWKIIAPIAAAVALVIGAIVSPITLISGPIALLAAAWLNNWGGIRDIALEVIERLRPGFEDFVENVKALVEQGLVLLSAWWEENGPRIIELGTLLFESIQRTFTELADQIIPWLVEKFELVSEWFVENGPLIEAAVDKIADIWVNTLMPAIVLFWEIVKPILDFLIDLILNGITAAMAFLAGDWEAGWAASWNIVKSFGANVVALLVALLKEITFFVLSAGTQLAGIFGGFLGIESDLSINIERPSTPQFEPIGGNQEGISPFGSSSREQDAARSLNIGEVNINNDMDAAQFNGMMRQVLFG